MFFRLKIKHEWNDKIIGRYGINMTYIDLMISYRDVGHMVKVSFIEWKVFLRYEF